MTTYAPSGHATAAAAVARSRSDHSMVIDQLDELLGEQLMPLRARRPGMDEPHLLAVDASGQPVVVEIVPVLDEEAAILALRHAGHAARMGTRELAEAYSGGADRFASHLAAFRLTVPATALLSTFVRGGVRLLLVCSHIAPGMDDVLEFLLQPGRQVDVLHATVVVEPDGNRVVELSPVSGTAPPRRAIDAHSWREPEPVEVPFDPTPLYRERPSTAEVAEAEPAAEPAVEPDAGPVWQVDRPVDWTSDWLAEASVEPAVSRPPAVRPVVVRPDFAVPYGQTVPVEPDPVLAAVAATLRAPAALVWCPEGAAECFEALLHDDGTLETTDGAVHGDLETLTRAISGLSGPLDVWQVWHVDGPAGPTLAELAAAAFPGQF